MPLGNWNLEWLNHNSQRSYPLTNEASKSDKTDSIQLPNDFLVGLYFPVHAGLDVDPAKFFLHTVAIFPTGYSLSIGYDTGAASPGIIATVNVARTSHTENRTYALSGAGNFDDSVGTVVIGRLDTIDTLPPGIYEFTAASGALESDCIRPMIRGISSLAVVSANGERSRPLVGDIELIAGNNIRLTVGNADSETPTVTISAIDGEGLNETCICDDQEEDATCIRTINGIAPLPDGNFRFIGDGCITIEPIANGMRFSDACSEPCCGCDELQALITQVDRFADGALTLQNFVNALNAQVSQFHSVVLGSRLGDQGCINC